jgi:hypothetical protein
MSEPHDRLLGALYAAQPAPPSGHPEEETWVRLAAHELPVPETQALSDHLARCPECSRIYRAVSQLEQEARAFDPAVPAPRRSGGWNRLALGGGLAAAAVLAWIAVRPPAPLVSPPPPDELRGGSAAAAVPVRPQGSLTARPAVFEWKPAADTRAYRVQVLNAHGDTVWSSGEVAGTAVALPADVALPPGRYQWQVLAIPTGGGQMSASGMAGFDLSR